MSTHADKLRDKIRADFEAVSRRNTDSTSTIKEEVADAIAFPAAGEEEWRLVDALRTFGYDKVAKSVEDTVYAEVSIPKYKGEDWPELYAGAVWADPARFHSYLPDPMHVGRMALWMSKGWSMLLNGPPSTGKTSLSEYFSVLMNQPFFRVNFNPTDEKSDLIGHPWVEEKGMKWMNGVLPIALEQGYNLCFDEIFRSPAFIPLSMQGVMDGRGSGAFRLLGKHEDDMVTPHPRCKWVFTDNTRGVGDGMDKFATANVHDTSFINRIRGTLHVGYMPKDKEVESLMMDYPECDNETVDDLVKLAGYCRNGYLKGEFSLVLGKRQLESICDILPYVGVRESLDVVFYSSLPEDESGAFTELYRDVFGKVW